MFVDQSNEIIVKISRSVFRQTELRGADYVGLEMWGFWDSIRSLTKQFQRAAQDTVFILTLVAKQQHTAVHAQHATDPHVR